MCKRSKFAETRMSAKDFSSAPMTLLRTLSHLGFAVGLLGLALFTWVNLNTNSSSSRFARAQAQPGLHPWKAISEIQVGERVVAENPANERDLEFGDDVDAPNWRKLELRAPKEDGSSAEIVLLRPIWWLQRVGAEKGSTIDINIPECGIFGKADVQAITPCPAINKSEGRVVTGTFKHFGARILDLYVIGQTEPIGTTETHPFWSEDRQTFVRAVELRPKEYLRGTNRVIQVIRTIPRDRLAPVFNLEVQVAHVYCVSSNGVLVHNGCAGWGTQAANTQVHHLVSAYSNAGRGWASN